MVALLGIALPKGEFISAEYHGEEIKVYRAARHFAYISRKYVREIANEIKTHLAGT